MILNTSMYFAEPYTAPGKNEVNIAAILKKRHRSSRQMSGTSI